MASEVERRLTDWAEHLGEEAASLYGDTNIIYRVMKEGAGAAGGGSPGRGLGAVIKAVMVYGFSLEADSKRKQVGALVARMPGTYMDVVEHEFLRRNGYRVACKQLGWSEKKWWERRTAMLTWMASKLELPAYEP